MKKRLVSIILTVFLVLSMMPFAAFADNAIVCPACGGEVTKKQYHLVGNYWDFYQCNTCGKWAYLSGVAGLKLFSAGDQAIINAADANAILNFAFNNGHLVPATKAPSGVGRKDLPGYADDNGSANINVNGLIAYSVPVAGIETCDWRVDFGVTGNRRFTNNSWHPDVNSIAYEKIASGWDGIRFEVNWMFEAPVTGTYHIYQADFSKDSSHGNISYLESSTSSSTKSYGIAFNRIVNRTKNTSNNAYDNDLTLYASKGDSLWFVSRNMVSAIWGKCTAGTLIVYVNQLDDSFTKSNNITINNNTWNGNIYTDNSTNLTYIYPQYTTINEKNETVTNISNNPIIYNNETKQYYTYDSVTNNYYYITYETTPTPTPSPSPAPAPTWTPGGGATRGGGVGRHPSDTDAADWTLHYYILNNRRYDAYYALKKTEVNTETKLPWVDNKKYISTTQIPIANGQYTVSVPDGVYWRVWQWDEASQTLTGVNSSNWHSTINNFLFNATGEYIFEFCKADGSDFNTAKDVTLKLKNDKITEYEPGGALDTEPVTPETQNLIIPKMNSNTFTDEHGTWIASGSSKYSDVFDFFYAFDRSTANFWETNVSPSHLQIEIPDPENYYIDGYIMRISKFTNRYAKEWTLQGSDDGKTWDDLDKQTGQNLSDLEEHKYSLTLRKAYKYYRVNMSNYASSMCSLSHFNLLGYDAKDVVIPTPSPSPTPAPTDKPGGGTIIVPGGGSGSGSGSGSGDNSWNPFKWLTDLLKDLIEDILKGLWKLLTSIFGFILWLLSLLFKLFPWMPNSGILALCAGVVVVTVIRIIKFITGR